MNPKNIAKSATLPSGLLRNVTPIPPLPSTSRPKSPPRSRPGISITTPTTTVTTQPPSRTGASSSLGKATSPAIVLQSLARGTGSGSSSSGVTQFVDTRSAPSSAFWQERRALSPRHQNTHQNGHENSHADKPGSNDHQDSLSSAPGCWGNGGAHQETHTNTSPSIPHENNTTNYQRNDIHSAHPEDRYGKHAYQPKK